MSEQRDHDAEEIDTDLAQFEDEFRDDRDDGADGADDGLDDADTGGFRFTLEGETSDPASLFPGDTSTLTYEQRHTLNVILKNPFLSAATHPAQWRTLLADLAPIVSRLHDLFLDLEVDREREVALKRPIANPGGDRFPTLFYDSRLSREETIVVIFLRSHYRAERGSGNDRVFVDTADIHDFAGNLRPETATDDVGDRRKVALAVEAIRKSGILVKTPEADRFEISAAIELLLPMSKLEAILADLRSKNGHPDPDTEPDTEPGTSPETNDLEQLMLEEER